MESIQDVLAMSDDDVRETGRKAQALGDDTPPAVPEEIDRLKERIAHLEEAVGMIHRTNMGISSGLGEVQGKVDRLEHWRDGAASIDDSVGEDTTGLLVNAIRALIYERDMAGCWRKDRADAEMNKISDILDNHFGGSYLPPDEDDDFNDAAPVAASTDAPVEKYPLPGRTLSDHLGDLYANDKQLESSRLQHEEQLAALRRDVDNVSGVHNSLTGMVHRMDDRLESLEGTDDPEYDDDDMPAVSRRMAAAARHAYNKLFGGANQRGRWKLAIPAALAAQGRREDVGTVDSCLERVKQLPFSKRKKFWHELQRRASKGPVFVDGFVVSWPDVLVCVDVEDWEASLRVAGGGAK